MKYCPRCLQPDPRQLRRQRLRGADVGLALEQGRELTRHVHSREDGALKPTDVLEREKQQPGNDTGAQLPHGEEPLQLLELLHIPAGMRDDEAGTAGQLADHLEVLQVRVCRVVLEGVDHRSGEEAGVSLPRQAQYLEAVQVPTLVGQGTPVAGTHRVLVRTVASHGEEVTDALAASPGQRGADTVGTGALAGEHHQRRLARGGHQGLRRRHGIVAVLATQSVGHGQRGHCITLGNPGSHRGSQGQR